MGTLTLPPFDRGVASYGFSGAQAPPGPRYSPQTNTVQQQPIQGPAAAPSPPSISVTTPQSAYLPYGYSDQLAGFDPMVPGGGFYPGLLGGQQPTGGGMGGMGPQMYFGAGGAGFGSQSGAARSFDTMTTQGQVGQAVGNVLRSGYTLPVTNTINEGLQLARQQRAQPSPGFGLLAGRGAGSAQPMPAPNRLGDLL